jgi:hypothetical protein
MPGNWGRFAGKELDVRSSSANLGTKYTLSAECGLARGNPHQPGVLDLFSQSSHFDHIGFVD